MRKTIIKRNRKELPAKTRDVCVRIHFLRPDSQDLEIEHSRALYHLRITISRRESQWRIATRIHRIVFASRDIWKSFQVSV